MRVFKREVIPPVCLIVLPLLGWSQEAGLDAAKHAYEMGQSDKAVEILKSEAAKEQSNGDIQLLLTKAHLELKQYDAAVSSAEKAVAADPKNSMYHQWLGEAYGEKADHASMLSAYSLARKTQKEFETAVELDEKNFSAAQDLVEYDCTAPSMAGGGTEKAQPLIQKLLTMDPAEGLYAAGNCKAAKKDYPAADAEFAKALESKPKSVERVFNMADYFSKRGQAEKVLAAADIGQSLAPQDARTGYYQALGSILKNEKLPDAEKALRRYLHDGAGRPDHPKASEAHYWLGRLYETQKNVSDARSEYESALKLDPKYKKAQEALKQLGK